MAIIKVPKTPASAFNPRRTPSDLIRQQIKHLEWALLPAAQRQPTRRKDGTLRWFKGGAVKTEAQAAAYIAVLTARVQDAYADYQARAARGLPRQQQKQARPGLLIVHEFSPVYRQIYGFTATAS